MQGIVAAGGRAGMAVGAHLGNRALAFVPEVSATVTNRIVPQGAAEIAQALFSGSNAYVPYGQGQRPQPPRGQSMSR